MNIQELNKGKCLSCCHFPNKKQVQSQLFAVFVLPELSFQVSNQHERSLKNEVPLFEVKIIEQSSKFLLQKNFTFLLDFFLKSTQLPVKNLQCILIFLQNFRRFRQIVIFLKLIILEEITLEIQIILLFF